MNTASRLLRVGYGSGVKWRALVWAAVLIATAAAVLLGVVALTAGLAAASGLAGVVVGFCELVAVALAVIGWAGERQSAAGSEKKETNASALDAQLRASSVNPGPAPSEASPETVPGPAAGVPTTVTAIGGSAIAVTAAGDAVVALGNIHHHHYNGNDKHLPYPPLSAEDSRNDGNDAR